MLTPNDKVTKRGGNDIIQIVVTRSCDVFTCSNCTQLLPFRTDAKEMSIECAEAALQSLEGWPGVVAMFGGNPLTHSRFADLCDLWKKHVPDQRKRGLWTNNLISVEKAVKSRETFWPSGRFNLNVHGSTKAADLFARHLPGVKVWGHRPSHHGAVFGSHADLGVPEDEWVQARERCDVNQHWSAGVYARDVACEDCGGTGEIRGGQAENWVDSNCGACDATGKIQVPHAYFCEIAGSIDGVTGGNNGVPATPGWWREPMERFQHQVRECCDKFCLVPLRLKGHADGDRTYDVTPSVVELSTSRVVTTTVHTTKPGSVHELTDYQGLRKGAK